MCYLYSVPSWFGGFDAIVSILIVILAVLTMLFSVSIYKFNKMWNLRLLAMSFGFLGLGYAIQAFHDSILFLGQYVGTCPPVSFLDVFSITACMAFVQTMSITIGLLLMLFLVLKLKNLKIFWILLAVSVYTIIFSVNIPLTFYSLGSFYLLFINYHFVKNYLKNRTAESLLIAEAFLVLLVGFITFIFALEFSSLYVVANFLTLISFLLITLNLVLIKNGAKKQN